MSEKPKIEISRPRRFGIVSILAKCAFSFLLALPFAAFLLLMSLRHLGQWTLPIGLLILAATVCLTPCLGNLYVSGVVRRLKSGVKASRKTLIVQITFCPRIRQGFRALIEDADDVGYLSLDDSLLTFSGDSVQMTVPFQRIKAVQGENVGLRGVYMASGRITLEIAGLDGFASVEIAERSSRLIFSSRRITREVFELIKSRVDAPRTLSPSG